MQHAHDLHFAIPLDEKDQITAMRRVAQTGVQVISLLETARALADLHNLGLDLSHERHRTGRVVERNEVANVDQVCPRGRQDNQLGHGSRLVGVAHAQLGKNLIGGNAWSAVQTRLDRIP